MNENALADDLSEVEPSYDKNSDGSLKSRAASRICSVVNHAAATMKSDKVRKLRERLMTGSSAH
jgi:hypothetical protein